MIAGLFGRRRADDHAAADLYQAIVAQARQPALYRTFAVPDTVEGRLEMILLHLVLLFQRLQRDGGAGQGIAQTVFDLFVLDMDRSLREMGIGDLGVPKRMKVVGQSFYGRLQAYGEPIAASDAAALARALQRNLFPDDPPEPVTTTALAGYAMAAAADLAGQHVAAIAGGALTFPEPAEAVMGVEDA